MFRHIARSKFSRSTSSRFLISTARSFRYKSTDSSSTTPPQNDDAASNFVMEESFAKHTMFVLNTGKRALKFAGIGLIGLGFVTAALYEGAHLLVENRELAPEHDEELKRWEWDSEAEDWTGDPDKGGTDPGMGFQGRHAVRAAWMAYNWGVGMSTSVTGTEGQGNEGLSGPAGIKVIDTQLQRAEGFLRTAVLIAENKSNLHPHTLLALVSRHAGVLEKLGPDYWAASRDAYKRVWEGSLGNAKSQAWAASKIGNLSSQLGNLDDASSWWLRTFQLALPDPPQTLEGLSQTLTTPPTSPAAQRTTATALVALSASYAKSGQLPKAQQLEEAGLGMLRQIKPSGALETASSPQLLHSLFLLQRSSLLSVHLAEVLYAQRRPFQASIQWLTSAAASSEQVARTLTNTQPPQQGSLLPMPVASQTVSAKFTSHRTTSKVAKALLRDARKTCAEAWNMIGILHETQSKDLPSALRCYQHAVEWAGTPVNQDGMKAAEGILEAELSGYLANLSRIRRALDGEK